MPQLLKPACSRAHALQQEKPPQWEAGYSQSLGVVHGIVILCQGKASLTAALIRQWVQCAPSGPGVPLAVAAFKVTAWMSLWGIGSSALHYTTPLAQVPGHSCKCFRLPLFVLSSLVSLIIGMGLAHCSWFEGVNQNCHLFMGGSLSFFLFGCAACRISVLLPGIELGQMAVKAWNPNHQATRELSKGPFSPSLCQEVSNTYMWYSPSIPTFAVKFTGMLLELSTILNLV